MVVRQAARVDANHSSIVRVLREAGCSVLSLAAIGKGCPDLLVSRKGVDSTLMELKDGDKPPSRRRLTPDQVRFEAEWKGRLVIVENEAEALQAMGISTR